MMDEYIKRIDVYAVLRRIYCDRCYGMDDCEVCDVQRVLNLVKAQPYCDVVEVVRCKDCKYCKLIKDTSGTPFPHCAIAYGMPEVRFSDYCNYGERRMSNE